MRTLAAGALQRRAVPHVRPLCPPPPTRRRTALLPPASVAGKGPGGAKNAMLVYVPPHPLVKHLLAVLRNAATPSSMFRLSAAELGRILIYEAIREFLPTETGSVDTPLGTAEVEFINPMKPVVVVPILRAGLILLDQVHTVLPASATYHVGYVRDETTLEAKCYLNKLPASFSPEDRIIVTDPMLATGGTMCQVLDDIISRGAVASNIRVISIVAAPPALTKMNERYKGLKVYTAMIDAELNDKGFIVPGLGDAGDRAFNSS